MYDDICKKCPNVNDCENPPCAGFKALDRRAKNTIWFWQAFGAYCRICGYNKSYRVLHFHHSDRSQKVNNNDCLSIWLSSKNRDWILNKLKNLKFEIVCANCHAEIHAGITKVEDK